jgi:hypothetical protein
MLAALERHGMQDTPITGNAPGRSPWRTMWFSPRATVRRLIDETPARSWIPVVVLAGVSQAFLSLEGHHDALVQRPVSTTVLTLVQIGLVVAGVMIGSYVFAFLGGVLGGEGDALDVRQALAWAYVPAAVASVAWLPLLAAYGVDLFRTPLEPETTLQWVTLPLLPAILIAGVWTLVLLVPSLSEALRLSLLRAFALVALTATPFMLLGLLR